MLYGGLRIECNPFLEGCKLAIKAAGTLYVSPALHSLLKSESGEAFKRLVESIRFIEFPTPAGLDQLTPPALSTAPPE